MKRLRIERDGVVLAEGVVAADGACCLRTEGDVPAWRLYASPEQAEAEWCGEGGAQSVVWDASAPVRRRVRRSAGVKSDGDGGKAVDEGADTADSGSELRRFRPLLG